MLKYIFIIAGVLLSAAGIPLYIVSARKPKPADGDGAVKPEKRRRRLFLLMSVAGGWLAATGLLTLIFGSEKNELAVDIFAARTGIVIFGYNVSETVLTGWIVLGVTFVLALALRIFVIPRFTEKPKRIQALLEAAVGWIEDLTAGRMKRRSGFLNVLLFAIAGTLLGYAVADLAGLRSPASDTTFTLTLAVIVYIVINVYTIRNRKRKFKNPMLDGASLFVKTIYKVIMNISTPISMGCRLFGNMISGTIVMDLIYTALGPAALGLPDVVMLYFGVFSSLIQLYIFVMLTLTYVADTYTE